MKKILLFIVIFAILAVGCTSILIKVKNEDRNLKDVYKDGVENLKEELLEEKSEDTLNLKGTYKQNDLIIVEKELSIEECETTVKIPQINGLKNKEVEEKINENIQKQFNEKLGKIVLENEIIELICDYDISANFSNVLSIRVYVSDYNIEMYKEFYLNYNLIDGDELKFGDMFKKGEDLKSIIRVALYRGLVLSQSGESFYNNDCEPYYDNTDGIWYVKKEVVDDEGIVHDKIEEYVLPMSEYEIEKNAEKFLNNAEKNFFFSPSDFAIRIDEKIYSAYFYDMPEKVVIYNKYLTKESLYENDNINSKSFIACSEEGDLGKYKETRYESENFFYDINVVDGTGDEFPAKKFVASKMKNQSKEIEEKIAEYKKTAQDNPDKAYFVFIEARNYNANNNHYEYNQELGYYTEISKTLNLLTVDLETKMIVCDIEEKDDILEKILSVYRYYNLRMYGNAINGIHEGELVGGEILDLPVIHDTNRKCYDVITGNEITSVKEIFKDDVDYIEIIKNSYSNSYNPNINIDSNTEIYVTSSGICWYENDNETYCSIYYNDVEDYLKLKELKPEILPSRTRIIDQEELNNLDKDEINRAYNEMFARYGHDFKNTEYKHYFNLWDWYEPIEGKKVSIDEFTEIEKYNYNLIKNEIEERN